MRARLPGDSVAHETHPFDPVAELRRPSRVAVGRRPAESTFGVDQCFPQRCSGCPGSPPPEIAWRRYGFPRATNAGGKKRTVAAENQADEFTALAQQQAKLAELALKLSEPPQQELKDETDPTLDEPDAETTDQGEPDSNEPVEAN